MSSNRLSAQEGGAIIGALIISAFALLILGGVLSLLSSGTRAAGSQGRHSRDFYEVNDAFQRALVWLRENSTSLVWPFTKEQFYKQFDRSLPLIGPNDDSGLAIHSRLRINGTKDTPILVSDPLLAQERFPDSFDLETGEVFIPTKAFEAAEVAHVPVRITLVDALAQKSNLDYGDPDEGRPEPATDFYPVFRIDAMSDLFEGAHIYGYVTGSLVYGDVDFGFQGEDLLQLSADCDAYQFQFDKDRWVAKTRLAECSTASRGPISIKTKKYIFGSADAIGGLTKSGKWKGEVCRGLEDGCKVPGDVCEGKSCQVPLLPAYPPWKDFCPDDQGDLIVKKSQDLDLAGAEPKVSCWRKVTVNAKQALTLTSTQFAYRIKELVLKNKAVVIIRPNAEGGRVELSVEKLQNDRFTGAQLSNQIYRPFQFLFKYHGTRKLQVLGTAEHRLVLEAPGAAVSLSGKNHFFGAIKAKSLTVTNLGIHFDEASQSGAGRPSDMKFTIQSVQQRYR